MQEDVIKRKETVSMAGGDRGSAIVEASVGVPIFLFLLLLLYHLLHVQAVKTCIYEAAVEAAEYTAEIAYLEDWAEEKLLGGETGTEESGSGGSLIGSGVLIGVAEAKILSSLDEPDLVKKYVVGGRAGILLLGSSFPDDEGDIVLLVTYTIRISTPMLPDLTYAVQEEIHQKPYLGHSVSPEENDGEDRDAYVYVTDNREVYHTRRSCSHLLLDCYPGIRGEAEKAGYRPCSYCGADAAAAVIICPEGEAYHSSASCRGLRRHVHRVKLSEVAGLPACSRCGR